MKVIFPAKECIHPREIVIFVGALIPLYHKGILCFINTYRLENMLNRFFLNSIPVYSYENALSLKYFLFFILVLFL
jgi:hypothetical protein